MPSIRPTVRLLPHEDALLRTLYREYNIATDQYPQRSDDLMRLVDTFNNLTGRKEVAADLLHYMISRRKKKRWEKLGRGAGDGFSPPKVDFTEDELKHLDAIHEEFQIASDNFALNQELAEKLQKEFARRAGRIVPHMILAAAMINRRKAGSLATLKPKADGLGVAFSDIKDVAN